MMLLCFDVLKALQGKTLATAESCTGGGIGAALTAVPGSSKVYKGGIVCYTNSVKETLLGVSAQLLDREGAVSAPVACAMAEGARAAINTDVAVSVTGAVVDVPVFMPLVGMDKEEIVTIARKIGTMETSVLPYEDCCTVFTPKHPKTKPTLGQVLHAERNLDREALILQALESVEKITVKYDDAPLF